MNYYQGRYTRGHLTIMTFEPSSKEKRHQITASIDAKSSCFTTTAACDVVRIKYIIEKSCPIQRIVQTLS